MAVATPDPDSAYFKVATWIASVIGGAVVTLVTFRTRIALLMRDNKSLKTELREMRESQVREAEELETRVMRRLKEIERRQRASLRLSLDIARKVGADSRIDDSILRIVTDAETEDL